MLRKILNDSSFRLSIIVTVLFIATGMAFLFLGLANYSWVLFILLPVALGISIGAMPDKKYILWGAIITIVACLFGLYIPGLSGLLCIVMALPLVASMTFLACVLTHLVRRYRGIRDSNKLSVLWGPLLLFMVFAPVVRLLNGNPTAVVEVTTRKTFDFSPEQVYDAIKSVDTLDAEKPFLMMLDLPVPTKCVLEKEAVGGRRICYFKGGRFSNADFGGGTIVEEITALERGKVLKMKVTDYNLIGRKWLGFKEAIYYFDSIGESKCRLTRITTYTSLLTPRFYWQPLEELGIRQEHDYVFANLAKDLNNRYRKTR